MKKIKLAGNVPTPRDWQTECTYKALQWLTKTKKDKRFLINAAPGTGKTICASWIAANLIDMGEIEKVIVIAPRSEVVDQWAVEFKQVTGKEMIRITGSDTKPNEFDSNLCSTWSAISGLLEAYQITCKEKKTLVICDEHHHAAISAAWGTGAYGAFEEAKYIIVLTGTPYRSDEKETAWLRFGDDGKISHPMEGSYEITYGEAVDLGYCRPITFHRHEGNLKVVDKQGTLVAEVSGEDGTRLSDEYSTLPSLQKSLNYYQTACTIPYKNDGVTVNYEHSYQKTMLEAGIAKLEDLQDRVHNAGGLVIAPSIPVANYMAELLKRITKENVSVVHYEEKGSEKRIKDFRNSNRKWIVSVGMISEGVDIKRLRVLVYLPKAQTELSFRQSMGRVVRSLGVNDDTRAYVVMPTHKIFEEFARRVENEMSPGQRKDKKKKRNKICPVCETECLISQTSCDCGYEFPNRKKSYKKCLDDNCGVLNPISADECQSCGLSFKQEYIITLDAAARMGVIVRGSDVSEENTRNSEIMYRGLREDILKNGNQNMINIFKIIPEEQIFEFISFGMKHAKAKNINT